MVILILFYLAVTLLSWSNQHYCRPLLKHPWYTHALLRLGEPLGVLVKCVYHVSANSVTKWDRYSMCTL